MPDTQAQPAVQPEYLTECDGFLDGQFDHFGEHARTYGARTTITDITSQHWAEWPTYTTPWGYTLYLHPMLQLPPRRLILLLANRRDYSWFLHATLADGRIVLVMRNNGTIPMGYALGKIPWKPFNWNFPGCLRFGLILAFCGVLLAMAVGLALTYG